MSHFIPLSVPVVAIICFFAYKIAKLYRPVPGSYPSHQPEAADMMAAMERMEDRIATLERILDVEAPQWRDKWRNRS